jgi:serine phosphatase RsbU (regulator of sigma subunit)
MQKIILWLALIALHFSFLDSYADNVTDTEKLQNDINLQINDSLKVGLLIELSDHKSLSTANALARKLEALNLSKKISNPYLQALSNENIAGFYLSKKSDFNNSLVNYLAALKLCDSFQMTNLKGKVYIGLAGLYLKKGDLKNAEIYYSKGTEIKEKENDPKELAKTYNNFGNFYNQIGEYEKALNLYQKSLVIRLKQKDTLSIAVCYDNIGNAYSSRGKELKSKNDYDLAEAFYNKALSTFEVFGDKLELAICYLNLSEFYFEKSQLFTTEKDKEKALENCQKGLGLSKEMGFKEGEAAANKSMSQIYESQNNPVPALIYFKRFKEINDSIISLESNKHIAELQTQYDVDKKDKEITILNKDKKIQTTELNRQRIVRNSFIGGFVLVFIFAFFIYRSYVEKKKVNLQLSSAKSIIENKNKNITDSINYAQRIQNAILPSKENLTNYLPESFILFKPKDIVSGDFYWFNSLSLKNETDSSENIIVAAADCTGHGVPGAFMSVIGNNLLTEIVKEKKVNRPSEILNLLNKQVREALKQNLEGAETNDGMDICLCSIDLKNSEFEYAGANRPLYIYRKYQNELVFEEIKPSKLPIGGSQYDASLTAYKNHKFTIQKGDTFYLFSDGYCDQFGGEHDKKFMSKKFRELLSSLQHLNMKQQEVILRESIENWMGKQEQSDDILVIGLRPLA